MTFITETRATKDSANHKIYKILHHKIYLKEQKNLYLKIGDSWRILNVSGK